MRVYTLAIAAAMLACYATAADIILYSTTAATSAYPAMVPKTGQTTSYATGDDGDLEKGTAWPVPRFTICANTNCVQDNLTGLHWSRNLEHLGTNTYTGHASAISNLNATAFAGRTDWRMANFLEAFSLADFEYTDPALCNTAGTGQWTSGDPFFFAGYNTINAFFTGSTRKAGAPANAWVITARYWSQSYVAKTGLNYALICAGPD